MSPLEAMEFTVNETSHIIQRFGVLAKMLIESHQRIEELEAEVKNLQECLERAHGDQRFG